MQMGSFLVLTLPKSLILLSPTNSIDRRKASAAVQGWAWTRVADWRITVEHRKICIAKPWSGVHLPCLPLPRNSHFKWGRRFSTSLMSKHKSPKKWIAKFAFSEHLVRCAGLACVRPSSVRCLLVVRHLPNLKQPPGLPWLRLGGVKSHPVHSKGLLQHWFLSIFGMGATRALGHVIWKNMVTIHVVGTGQSCRRLSLLYAVIWKDGWSR